MARPGAGRTAGGHRKSQAREAYEGGTDESDERREPAGSANRLDMAGREREDATMTSPLWHLAEFSNSICIK